MDSHSKNMDKAKDMEKIIVTAVVVTYNRKALLEKVIRSLLTQTVEIGRIIIVNNGSTDGTGEWLAAEYGNDPRFDIVTQENVGGSGGFHRGIKEAAEHDTDWIWCMDDDVFPTPSCLETLLAYAKRIDGAGILCPHRLMSGKTFTGEARTLNLSNPFRDMHNDMVTPEMVENAEWVEIEGMAFEGPLIRREVVEKIGLPNKDLFILYDDTDYSYRAVRAGYKVAVVRDALMEKHDFQSVTSYREEKMKNKWKLAYHIRNTAYFGHQYGKNVMVRYMAAIPFLITMYGAITFNFIKGHKYSVSDYALFWKMMMRGINGELGKITSD